MVRMICALLSSLMLVVGTQAEKVEFSSVIVPSGTQCFLENIGETIQGKSESLGV